MASTHIHERGYWVGEYRCDGTCKPTGKCKGHRDGLSRDVNGERFKSEKAAYEAAVIREHEARSSGFATSVNSKATLGEVAELWFSSNRANVRATTVDGYRDSFRAVTTDTPKHRRFPWLATTPACKITTADIDRVLIGLREQGLARYTIDNYFKALNGIFRFAVQKNHMAVNPCDSATRLDSLQGKAKEIDPFTEDELKTMAEAIDPRYRLLVLLGGYSGLRIGELFGLNTSDIRFDDAGFPASLYIERQINRRGEYAPTKNDNPRHTPVAPHIRPLLLQHLKRHSEPNTGLVFPAPRGGPLEYHNFRRRYWKKALEAANLTHRGSHSMRHHFATYALDHLVPVEIVTDWGGWSSTVMVYDLYRGKRKESDIDKYAHMMDSSAGVTPIPEGAPTRGADVLSGIVTTEVDELNGEIDSIDALPSERSDEESAA